MNIDINLLPKELRAKPLIDARTVVLIVLIIALAFGCYYFTQAKSTVQSENSDIQSNTEAMRAEAASLSKNAEAVRLTNLIAQIKSAGQNYGAFIASKMAWGDALQRVYDLAKVSVVSITSITQAGYSLEIKGTASNYGLVDTFARALEADAGFTLTALSFSLEDGYTIDINVAPGGGR